MIEDSADTFVFEFQPSSTALSISSPSTLVATALDGDPLVPGAVSN